MSNNLEEKFARWAKPPSESEEERCSNAIRMIKEALNNYDSLKNKNTEIFLQGSFENNTNIRRDSDIDICIKLKDTYYYTLPDGYSGKDYGFTGSDYEFSTFKNSVGDALNQKFGSQNVHRGNKAFSIDSNSYRVKGDVVATFEHRRFTDPPSVSNPKYISGVAFITDKGVRINNWPKQHCENGKDKNKKTGRSYKRTVRIFKNLRNEMANNGVTSANNFPSFLLECLCWNVLNSKYSSTQYTDIVKSAMIFLHENTVEYEKCKEWGEVSELKYLFRNSQPWTYQQANSFINDAWSFLKF